jgi:predicted nucleic acid-binding protein
VPAIAAAGPLYAAVDSTDKNHQRAAETLLRPDLQIVVPALVVAEVTYLVGVRLGPVVEARFLSGLVDLSVQAPQSEDWPTIAALVAQYGSFPLGGTDASIIVLAERLQTNVVITFDEHHFRAVRPRHAEAFRILPADA